MAPPQMAPPQMAPPQMEPPQQMAPPTQPPQMVPPQMAPQNQVIYPPQQGGLPVPNLGAIMQGGFQQATFPGQGGMIVVDTSGGAMAAEGLGPMPPSGSRRTRASYQGGGGPTAPAPTMSAVMPPPSGGFQNITITKLE